MNARVVFSPEAEEHLAALYRYIAGAASPAIALRYTDAIVGYCENLSLFPHRGNKRDDIRPGLRITHYKRRVVIAFDVQGEDAGNERVSIIGIFYGGQDYENMLKDDAHPSN